VDGGTGFSSVFICVHLWFPFCFPLIMSEANVSSVDAIDMFRAALLVYVSKARPVLEDACDEVSRTRQWLQTSQRVHWENEVRKRTRVLENAQQALFSASIANLHEQGMAEKAAVTRAKRALTDAEDKLRRTKRWSMDFDQHVGPLVKQLEQLRTVLANSLPKATVHLSQVVKTLDAYANVAPSSAGVETAPIAADAGSTDENPAQGTDVKS
jgi:hypothetical protein